MLFTQSTSVQAPVRIAVEYPLFDWLRFALASAVVLGHAGVIRWEHAGNLAVQVFFALSGWLIGGILLRSLASDLPRFFFNRATRIWIPYFCAVALLYAVSALRDPISARWLQFLFYDLTFTHNWFALWPDATTALAEMPLRGTGHHFWSIAVEEQFYLVAPLVIVLIKGGRSPLSWAVIAAAAWAAGLTDFASISLGVLAAAAQVAFSDWHRGATPGLGAVALVSGVGLAFVSYPIAAPIFAISIVLLCARPGQRGSLGTFAGGMSYPFYLNHWVGMFLANGIAKATGLLGPAATGLLAYLLAVLICSAAYLLVDRTVMQHRGAFFNKRTGVTLGIVAYALVTAGLIGGIYHINRG